MNDGQRATRNRQRGLATTFPLMQGAIILTDLDDRGD
jgi:hypothetical protein